MVSEKPWQPEAVLVLLASILITLGLCFIPVSIFQAAGTPPQFIGFLIGTIVVQSLVIVLVHFFLRYHRMTWAEFLGLRRGRLFATVLFAVGIALLSTPVALGANQLSAELITLFNHTPEQQTVVKVLEQTESPMRRAIFALAAILMAPLVEETIFRGILYPMLKYRGYPRLAIWGTSLFFAAVHLNLLTFLPLFLFALVLIWIYERTDTLLAPITAHAFFNTINFVLLVNQKHIENWWATLRERV
jgi:membrane protease YdiL (CAAX protease family)